MKNLPISVIICAYTEERWDALLAAVSSVQMQELPARQIILVIDHNPALLARARAAISGDVQVIENSARRGLSGARNSGIAEATSEVVAFMDEDAVASPDWLRLLARGYEDAAVLGVGGAIVPDWLDGQPAWFPDEFNWVVGCTYRGMPERAAPVRNLIGCNMSFQRVLFEQVGGFQSGIGRIGADPFGCEETEFCIRVQQAHPERHFLYVPAARVYHRVPASRADWSYFRARCYAEGRSKARVTESVGAKDGLASERDYTFKTLPLGIARGLRDSLMRRNSQGLKQARALIAGLGITTAGYAAGRIEQVRPIISRSARASQAGH